MSCILLMLLPMLGSIVSAAWPNMDVNLASAAVTACQGLHGALLSIPGSCSGFYMCQQGSAIASSCGEFYRFNAEKGFCDHPANVVCKDHNPTLHEQLTQQADELNSQFNSVLLDEALIRQPKFPLPKPIHPDEVNSDASAGNICVGQLDGVQFPKAFACEQFYVCIQQNPYRRTCASGTHFSAALSECVEPVQALCPWYQPKPEKPKGKPNLADLICVNAPQGSLVAHNADCGKFFYCHHALPLEMKCPKGLHFSATHRVCVWPQQASCVKLYRNTKL